MSESLHGRNKPAGGVEVFQTPAAESAVSRLQLPALARRAGKSWRLVTWGLPGSSSVCLTRASAQDQSESLATTALSLQLGTSIICCCSLEKANTPLLSGMSLALSRRLGLPSPSPLCLAWEHPGGPVQGQDCLQCSGHDVISKPGLWWWKSSSLRALVSLRPEGGESWVEQCNKLGVGRATLNFLTCQSLASSAAFARHLAHQGHPLG